MQLESYGSLGVITAFSETRVLQPNSMGMLRAVDNLVHALAHRAQGQDALQMGQDSAQHQDITVYLPKSVRSKQMHGIQANFSPAYLLTSASCSRMLAICWATVGAWAQPGSWGPPAPPGYDRSEIPYRCQSRRQVAASELSAAAISCRCSARTTLCCCAAASSLQEQAELRQPESNGLGPARGESSCWTLRNHAM